MSASELNKFIKRRSAYKGLITKVIATIDSAIEQEDLRLVTAKLAILETKKVALSEVNVKIEALIEEDEIENNIIYFEEIIDDIINVGLRAKEFSSSVQLETRSNNETQHSTNDVCEVKVNRSVVQLPRLVLKTFSGSIQEWQGWADSFQSAVHSSQVLSAVEKFNYLRSLLEGEAAKTIAGLALTEANYNVAWDILKKRFGKPEILIKSHLRALLAIPPVNNPNSVKELRQLYDEFEIRTRSLDNLGVGMEKYGIMLVPTLESKLPSSILLELSRGHSAEHVYIPLQQMLSLLGTELARREGVEFAQWDGKQGDKGRHSTKVSTKRNSPGTVSALHASSENKLKGIKECIFCEGNHKSYKCEVAEALPFEERKDRVTKSTACFKCFLKGHRARFCKFKILCKKCHGRHQPLLCENTLSRPTPEVETSVAHATAMQGSKSKGGLLQTTAALLIGNEGEATVRVLFDSGSQCSFIKTRISRKLKFKELKRENLRISGFGGSVQNRTKFKKVEVLVKGLLPQSPTIKVQAVEIEELCAPVTTCLDMACVQELQVKGINLGNNKFEGTEDISLLIGADYYWDFITGNIVRTSQGPVAIESKLGWMLHGSYCNEMEIKALFVKIEENSHGLERHLKAFWELESIGIKDKQASTVNNDVLEQFEKGIGFRDGCYEVGLPWKDSCKPGSNLQLANRRLETSLYRLRKNEELLIEYNEAILSYVREGYAERVQGELVSQEAHYLPHHAVVRRDKTTTKLRVVFDGSAKDKGGVSLNDCLDAGPNLNADLFSLLLRFRFGRVALTADVKQAFLRIKLKPEDRDAVRYLWVDTKDLLENEPKVQAYRMKSVLFGLSSSPFLLAATMQYHFKKYSEVYPNTIEHIRKNFYVDDLLCSVDNTEMAKQIFMEARAIMREAGMELRKWQTNHSQLQEFMSHSCVVPDAAESIEDSGIKELWAIDAKVLGIVWQQDDDLFTFNGKSLVELAENETRWTKRTALSLASKVFDPLGFLAPFVIKSKIWFQSLWEIGLGWDQELPDHMVVRWKYWFKELAHLGDIEIPRWYFGELNNSPDNLELHIFCDASEEAYATCIYIRGALQEEVSCRLVAAKSRVAPLKRLSVPRLELMGAVIASRLAITVRKSLALYEIPSYYWTDSTIVWHWLRSQARKWKPFVANRVEEIQAHTDPKQWKHCPGIQNPADLPTRGISVKDLSQSSLWWNGPEWLKLGSENWPSNQPIVGECQAEEAWVSEVRKCAVNSCQVMQQDPILRLEDISSLKRLLRVTAWVYRFTNNIKGETRREGILNSNEIQQARKYWVVYMQKEKFGEERELLTSHPLQVLPTHSALKGLDVFLDQDLLRVGGRLQFSGLPEEKRHPILLPSGGHFVDLLILDTHHKLLHAGVREVIIEIRQQFWIPKIRQVVKKVLHKCVVCKRWSAKPYYEKVAPLPRERCVYTAPFDVVGVDFAGPVYVYERGESNKGYICLFTCATTRAIHLELVSNLSSDVFLLAFKRFVNRRGFPNKIISDNAKTFKKAAKELQEIWSLLKEEGFQSYFSHQGVQWEFIVERAPWWGGFWERLVRSVKCPLKKLLANAHLSKEEFSTVLCEVEAMVNSRPITFVYNSMQDAEPLTPNHFLCGKRLTSNPSVPEDLQPIQSTQGELTRRFRYLEELQDQLWKRWQMEYLPELNYYPSGKVKGSNANCIKVGEVVMIGDERPRQCWKLGIIEELFVGKDNLVRSALVKTSGGKLKRPIQKLYALEISKNTDSQDETFELQPHGEGLANLAEGNDNNASSVGSVRKSRRGRTIVVPRRYDD